MKLKTQIHNKSALDDECQSIADSIERDYKSGHISSNKHYRLITIDSTEPDTADYSTFSLYRQTYHFSSIKWLKNLDIYVSDTDEISDYRDVMCIMDNSVYSYDEDSTSLVEIHRLFSFENSYDNPIVPFITKNGLIERATILIVMPPTDMYFEDMGDIIRHEIGHLFDFYIQKADNDDINNDLIELTNAELSDSQTDKCSVLVNGASNWYLKMRIIAGEHPFMKINYDDISAIIRDSIYILNISELHQRLINFRRDMRTHSSLIKNTNKSVEIQNILCSISDIYNEYLGLYQFFDLCIEYLDDELKDKFVDNDIANVYGKDGPDGFKHRYPYKNNFGYSKLNSNEVFDNFCRYHKDMIMKHFLKKANSMFIDYSGINENKKSFAGLSH